MNKELWQGGFLPFEQRRSIERFEEYIERTLGEFTYVYSVNIGPVGAYVPSNLEACSGEGFEFSTAAIAFAPSFDHDDMISAVAHTFTLLGYKLLTQGERDTLWMNKANGGYITFLFLDGGGAGPTAFLGYRPTDGITKIGQARNTSDRECELTPNTP